MGLLTKDQILQASDLPRETVAVPEWGGDVTVRLLTAFERDQFETSIGVGDDKNLANLRARLVSMCVVDANGERMFTTAKDVEALGKKSSAVVNRLFDVCKAMNGIGEEAAEAAVGN